MSPTQCVCSQEEIGLLSGAVLFVGCLSGTTFLWEWQNDFGGFLQLVLVLGLVLFSFGLIKYSPATPWMCLRVDSCHQHSVYVVTYGGMVQTTICSEVWPNWYTVATAFHLSTYTRNRNMYVYGSHGTATHGSHLEIDAVIWSNFRAYVCDAACFAANQNTSEICMLTWLGKWLVFWSTVYVVGNFFQRHRTSGIDVCMTWPTQVVD